MSTASKKPADVGEWRRPRAWELHQVGWWQKDIAAALGVSRAAICPWITGARAGGGVEALRSRPHLGGPSKLTAEQRAQIPALLASGAPASGFRGDGWTARRIAAVIRRTFGVRYHPDHVSRLLRQAGWSVQRPIRRATQRDEAAITRWHEQRWPAIKKEASDDGYPIVWGDESGFYLLQHAERTWAPPGETPVWRVPLTHDHLTAISGITLDGRLYRQVREQAFDAAGVVGFLRVPLRKSRGKVLVIWDGSPIHRGQAIKDSLAGGAARRLHLE